ncbi:MAG: hypothetical protein OXE84_04830 [Rhodobacteraceae bacterium]|nr:hypothetical protein [Paracoccaceae bacterium]
MTRMPCAMIIGLTLLAAPAWAQNTVGLNQETLGHVTQGIIQVITGLRAFLGPLELLVYAIAWVTGAAMMVIGVSMAAHRADQGPGRGGWAGPIACLLAGSALLALPTLLNVLSNSLFRDDWSAVTTDIFSTAPHLTQAFEQQVTQDTIVAILLFVQLVGIVAVFRGILLLNAAVDRRATIGAGLTHLIGGALALNIGPVLNIIDGLVA